MGGALVLESINPEIRGRVSARLTPGGVPRGQESYRSYSLRGGQWLVPKGFTIIMQETMSGAFPDFPVQSEVVNSDDVRVSKKQITDTGDVSPFFMDL
ncbi:hypothetical protein Tco_1276683 [Tanacetum coccineum]